MSTSSVTPAPITFNGSSTYSSAFQQVINRAVSIASLPMEALQGDVTTLTGQQSALTSLGTDFSALQSAVQALGNDVAGSPSAQVSDSSAVSATASAGALDGTYTIQVDDVGSSTTTLSDPSLPTVTDPTSGNISSASSFTLTVNGVSNTITPSGTSLEDLASAINSAGDGVQATIVNVGSDASPDYRLAVTSDNLGADTVQLNDGTNDLLDTLSTGADAQYKVNGGATDVQSTSSQLTLSPGLTVNLLAQTSSPVTITVSNDYSALENDLSDFVSAYNSAAAAVQKNVGQNGGALQGDSLIDTLTGILGQITQYTSGSGSVSNLADLGLTLDDSGQLSFDSSTFSAASPADVQQFLGSIGASSSSGAGFLQTVNNDLTSVTDTTSGLVATDYNSIQAQIAGDNSKISDDQVNIGDLTTNLQAQLSQADATIATLQSQDTYFNELFQAEYGTNGTNSSGG
ncbi:MAG: flagellar filament capping protein FliD [Bryobacteraceae bacterium]|jgi:flagellar hook-associated protein 2